MLLTQEQLDQIATVFNLERTETLPVRDGVVGKKSLVWWRCNEGAVNVKAENHWDNIARYPDLYQIAEPKVKIVYED